MASRALRIILCGKNAKIATTVKVGLLPEYEVIHVILSPSAGEIEIPVLLAGQTPAAQESANLGTQDYSAPPDAVVLGGGYNDESVRRLRAACECKGMERGVPWLRPDANVPTPPLGAKYGAHVAKRVKACLGELEEEGRSTGDGVYFY